MNNMPLVSVVIPNYNYAKYLPKCLESVFNQTYTNIEVIVQDNNSTDESYKYLLEQELKIMKSTKNIFFSVAQNKYNMGSDKNTTIALQRAYGDYIVILSSDDSLKPTFIERCVNVFEHNSSVGMVMVHRDEIDENDNIYKTAPFYNTSFVVDGYKQAAVFMMAGIAVPTQIMLKKSVKDKAIKFHSYTFQVAGDWYSNFMMSLSGDIGYIKEALCEYRVHASNETSESERKLLGIFEHYQLINAFNETAKNFNIQEPQTRYEKAVKKLGEMCLRYALKMLKNNENSCAKKYLCLVPIFDEDLLMDDRYLSLHEIIQSYPVSNWTEKIIEFETKYEMGRSRSYDPPEGFKRIDKRGEILVDY